MRLRIVAAAAVIVSLALGASPRRAAVEPGLVLRGTVVTMDDNHTVIPDGRVLVRGGLIAAVWSGADPPPGVDLAGVHTIGAGAHGLIFPGLINLHDHPGYDVLQLWPPPSSHREPDQGRPTGREPYDNRYQWSSIPPLPPSYLRLVRSPHDVLEAPDALDTQSEALVYAEARAALGGETAVQGEPHDTLANGLLVRNVEGVNFGRARADSYVPNVLLMGQETAADLRSRMTSGSLDAWFVHLAEGVPDRERASRDLYSSRHEFDALRELGLLTDTTVIIHGTGLERADFTAMRSAPAAGPNGDGLGAKLVWSPLSNLLLYGRTTRVYDALAEHVTVSLGTDWRPSGSNTLLDELKVADIAVRDRRILGGSRAEVPTLRSDVALDRTLVDMVTRNPAKTMRWWSQVGSVEPGKHADLLLLRRPSKSPTGGMPNTPYRNLMDATQRDVRLVLVDGAPVAGDVDALHTAGLSDVQIVQSPVGRFAKGLGSRSGALRGRLALPAVLRTLRLGLRALGGNGAKVASGPPPPSRVFSYLRAHWNRGADRSLSEAAFRDRVLAPYVGRIGTRINLERAQLPPLFTLDDRFFFSVLGGVADRSPPFRIYRANRNFVSAGKDPFTPRKFFRRWYQR